LVPREHEDAILERDVGGLELRVLLLHRFDRRGEAGRVLARGAVEQLGGARPGQFGA
jgi:hypothetical protein